MRDDDPVGILDEHANPLETTLGKTGVVTVESALIFVAIVAVVVAAAVVAVFCPSAAPPNLTSALPPTSCVADSSAVEKSLELKARRL